MTWYNTKMEQMDRLMEKMNEVKELLVSVRPMNYVGRIVISVKDDTEQKVVKHYGGKRWRRIVNFLRGVDENDPELGMKLGEKCVCLRESNVPIHTHEMQVATEPASEGNKWMNKDVVGSEVKMVLSSPSSSPETEDAPFEIHNSNLEYQMSPLEYTAKDTPTIPHDNMPPYREVYIWECVEITTDEQTILGDHVLDSFTITWNSNGGVPE